MPVQILHFKKIITLFVHAHTCVLSRVQEPEEVRRMCWILWSWSYR